MDCSTSTLTIDTENSRPSDQIDSERDENASAGGKSNRTARKSHQPERIISYERRGQDQELMFWVKMKNRDKAYLSKKLFDLNKTYIDWFK